MDDVKENKAQDVDDNVVDVDLPEESTDDVSVEATSEESDAPENEQEKVVNSAKDRIAKLTKKMRQMERREQEALRYAQQVQSEANNLKQRMQTMDSNYINEFGTRLEVETSRQRMVFECRFFGDVIVYHCKEVLYATHE